MLKIHTSGDLKDNIQRDLYLSPRHGRWQSTEDGRLPIKVTTSSVSNNASQSDFLLFDQNRAESNFCAIWAATFNVKYLTLSL
jgi:hypothetical protein